MFDDEVSAINIIDGLIDDARVLLVFLNVILIFALCISSSLINTRLFNIFAWITVIIASIDLLLTIIDVISGFWGENLVGSLVALVINTAITAVSVWALIKTLNYTNIQYKRNLKRGVLMENLGALILGIIDILVALGLLIWGVVAGIWYLIVIAVVLFVAPFIVMAISASGW